MKSAGAGVERSTRNAIIRTNMKSDNFKAFISVVLAAIFGGGISVFAKIGMKQIPPFSFTFFRFFIGIIFQFKIIYTLHINESSQFKIYIYTLANLVILL